MKNISHKAMAFLILGSLLLASSVSYAAIESTTGVIQKVTVDVDDTTPLGGFIHVELDQNVCGSWASKRKRGYLDLDTPGASEILRTAIAAKLSGQSVSLSVDNAPGAPGSMYEDSCRITRLTLEDQ